MAIEWCQVCGSSVWSGQPCGKCAHDGIVAARDAEIARLKDRANEALAACAEMRAAAVGVDGRCRLCTARPREHRDNCALSRTDLGRWWASPEDTAQMVGALQMVESDGEFGSLHEVTRKFVVDVLALLGKAGG